jgi:hypothetical protein
VAKKGWRGPTSLEPWQTWDVIEYDVRGNAKDGFEVNDEHKVGTVELPPDLTNTEFDTMARRLIAILKRDGWLRSDIRPSRIAIEWNEDIVEISDANNGKPEFRLQLREPE